MAKSQRHTANNFANNFLESKLDLRVVYTRGVGPAILLSSAISIEDFLSRRIAIASGKYSLFSRMCKCRFPPLKLIYMADYAVHH